MKIVFLSRFQKTTSRGVETFVLELAKRLSKKHQVEILSGNDADSLKKVLSLKPDIVIPLNGRWQALKMSLGRLLGGYKLLIGGHSGIGRDDIWNIMIVRPNVFVCLTEKALNWAKNFAWGVKLTKIPNGVDLDKFNPKGEKEDFGLKHPIILSVGSLSWYKNHDKVIEALSKMENGSLLIVGRGELESKLQNLAENKIPGRYKITSLNYDDLPKVYRGVDLFTLPSWDREAFGIVYLEAMASNIPVVAPDDESRREIVGNGGLLVNVGDIDQYAKTIQEALSTNWSNKPRQQAMKFSWDIIAEQYERLMLEMTR